MRVAHTISDLRDIVAAARCQGQRIGFVPTMGALHAGHGKLIDEARRETDFVVVSIFVNPAQFDRKDDFDRYPRNPDSDLQFCRQRGAGVVFAPEVEVMYPAPQRAFVEMTVLTEHLCGRFRPGHFRGVASVVLKLFNIVQPDRAFFGEKDAQQLAVIRRMVQDLNVPVTVVEVPTVREPDGLAMSSRNQRLSSGQRRVAIAIYRALELARRQIAEGDRDADKIKKQALSSLPVDPEVRVEFFEIVDPDDMQPVDKIRGPVRVAAAIWVGEVRLIDNILCAAA